MSKFKKTLKVVCALLVLALVTASFFGCPSEALCVFEPAPTIAFLVILLLTPIFGRLFCEVMCPLGTIQTIINHLIHPKKAVRRVCTRLPQSRAQLIFRLVILFALVGLSFTSFRALVWFLTPYSIYGKAIMLFYPGVILFGAIILLSFFGKGRIWCNWVCPIGTIFTILSKKSLCKHQITSSCKSCKACFMKSAESKECKVSDESKDATNNVTRRETLNGVAVLAASKVIEKTTDGGYADISLPGNPNRPAAVLPPGSVERKRFELMCVGCGLCASQCPGKCLVQSISLKSFGQVEMNFQKGFCLIGCNGICSQVCPTGAIRKLKDVARKDIHMGHAIWKKDRCIRSTDGEECTACVRKCPVKAIHLVEGFPVIDKSLCIGCGACEHVCPARPLPAIFVKGFGNQRIITPVNNQVVFDEMKTRLLEGSSCVTSRDGVIAEVRTGKGIQPLLSLLNEEKLKDVFLMDKVIGRAAAAICVEGGVKKVHAILASADAVAFLKVNNIEVTADKIVLEILNRDKTGECPLEKCVKPFSDPKKMVKALQGMMRK